MVSISRLFSFICALSIDFLLTSEMCLNFGKLNSIKLEVCFFLPLMKKRLLLSVVLLTFCRIYCVLF